MNLIGQVVHRDKLLSLLRKTDRAVVVVDGSGSRATGEIWSEVSREVLTLTGQLEARGTQVGVVQFSCEARQHKPVAGGSARPALEEVFARPMAGSSTGFQSAIRMAATMLQGSPGLILVFTDGASERDTVEVRRLEEQGVQVVGVGTQRDQPEELGNLFNERVRLVTGELAAMLAPERAGGRIRLNQEAGLVQVGSATLKMRTTHA